VRCWNAHLKNYFGGETLKADTKTEKRSGMKAARVGTAQIAGYVEMRQAEGAAKSTINRELALLRRAFSLGFDAEPQKVSRVPKFHRFIVSERAINNTVSLYSGETENGEPRTVYLTEECRLLVTELRKSKQPENFLLTRDNGEPIHDLRGTWAALTEEAKLPGLLLHDFRRSAVRNMIRRGVAQKTAREISGHKTDSVFNRYNIVGEADLQDAARKIEAGAKAVIHSSFTVEPGGPSNERRQKEQKPIQSVS